MKYFKIKLLLFLILLPFLLNAQEALKSIEEEYYNFLSLQGLTERPALNYRTLSDSVWNIEDGSDHPWQNQNLVTWHPLFGDFHMRVYGPDLFMSYNTEAPYGNYDGVLWQGRGFNTLFKSGVRFEGYGIELTFIPHLSFSQNQNIKIMPSHYDNEFGYFWGYGKSNSGVDAPQRFGDKPFYDWDFGDSEIRYTWRTLTIGFGTQSIWLGSSQINPILHSNNAPSYPKFDIGLRRQGVTIPWVDRYIGDIETRLWIGKLSESDYYDNNNSNDYTMLHGLAFAYAPSFIPGLTLFFNRVCLVPWEWENIKYIYPSIENINEDQKMSLGFSWLFPAVGFEVYGEIGLDDYVVGGGSLGRIGAIIRHPFHTYVYLAGLRKSFEINQEKNIYGLLSFEINWMEMTQDFQLQWPYSFYFHHQLTQGYTNRGQWLGNGKSPGGNSQTLSFILFYPKGNSQIFLSRSNPDSNFIYKQAIGETTSNNSLSRKFHRKNKANFDIGLNSNYFLNPNLILSGGFVYNIIINPVYFYDNKLDFDGNDIYQESSYINNFSLFFGVKIIL